MASLRWRRTATATTYTPADVPCWGLVGELGFKFAVGNPVADVLPFARQDREVMVGWLS